MPIVFLSLLSLSLLVSLQIDFCLHGVFRLSVIVEGNRISAGHKLTQGLSISDVHEHLFVFQLHLGVLGAILDQNILLRVSPWPPLLLRCHDLQLFFGLKLL